MSAQTKFLSSAVLVLVWRTSGVQAIPHNPLLTGADISNFAWVINVWMAFSIIAHHYHQTHQPAQMNHLPAVTGGVRSWSYDVLIMKFHPCATFEKSSALRMQLPQLQISQKLVGNFKVISSCYYMQCFQWFLGLTSYVSNEMGPSAFRNTAS